MSEHRHVDEHEDELDAVTVGTASGDAARIADAIALGFERVARAIEAGLREVAEARRASRRTRHRGDRG